MQEIGTPLVLADFLTPEKGEMCTKCVFYVDIYPHFAKKTPQTRDQRDRKIRVPTTWPNSHYIVRKN